MEVNIRTLSECLQQTLDPVSDKRRLAEKSLESIETNENYPILLLELVHKKEHDMNICIAAAIAFKNYIKRNWTLEEGQLDKISEANRSTIKNFIVTLMLSSPDSIQKQLSDAISIIGKTDFPTKWPELITQMVEKFATGDFHIINGILQTAHSLFKKYRYEFKSNELWSEIKYVLDTLAQPLTNLFLATMSLTESHANDPVALKIIYNSLTLICKVFYSLNFQDLPEFFEDNMKIWMPNFNKLLNADVKCLQTDDNSEPGVMEQLKSQVCDNAALYAQKYDEEFQPYLPQFVTDVWGLLVNTGPQPKYDLLVSNALQFLSSVASRNHYRTLFEDDNVLISICEKVIIPNMEFRPTDEEVFEDDPEEYIRRDMEGSDVYTRRRAACDLVNVLSQNFESRIVEIFGRYIQAMLGKFAENPAGHWRSKDAAIYLVTSLVSRGSTQKFGVTQTSQLVSVPQFCVDHVLGELEKSLQNVDDLPVLKADAIKYIITFRSILPTDMVVNTMPHLIHLLISESAVVHSYAAITIEKILLMKNANHQFIVTSTQLKPFASQLLSNLFMVLEKPVSEENEYIMKAIMRSMHTLQTDVLPYLGVALPKLTQKLALVAKNPSRPHFNHYLFETFALTIGVVCKTNPQEVTSFEGILFPTFEFILKQDVQEFMPYVFQLLSFLIESGPVGEISDSYMQMLPCLLAPILWERSANVNALVRLMNALVIQASPQIIAQNKLPGLLGVFQKLIASKLNDHEGFLLIQNIIQHFPTDALQPYNKQILILLFQRLSSSKTTKFVTNLMVFFCTYIIRYSAQDLVQAIDDIQAQMMGRVLEKLFISEMQKISGILERKVVACGITKLLCECPAMYEGPYQHYWSKLLSALLVFFECPIDESTMPEDEFVELDETATIHGTCIKLNFATVRKTDPLQAVTEPRDFLVKSLSNLTRNKPTIVSVISQIDQQSQIVLQGYCAKFGVQLHSH